MPSISDLTLKNAAAANVVFKPTRSAASPSTFVFEDRTPGVKAGYNTVRVDTRTNGQNGATHVDIVVTAPRLAVTAPASGSGIQPNPTRAYAELGSLKFVRPAALEQSVANDFLAYIQALVLTPQFIAWIRDGDLPY